MRLTYNSDLIASFVLSLSLRFCFSFFLERLLEVDRDSRRLVQTLVKQDVEVTDTIIKEVLDETAVEEITVDV